jgi:hypothetical protein
MQKKVKQMKVKVEYTPQNIVDLIRKDMENKLGKRVEPREIQIQVRSKQNYREKEWENGELKVELEVEV